MKKQELIVKCIFSKNGADLEENGADLEELILRSFQLYLRHILASDNGNAL